MQYTLRVDWRATSMHIDTAHPICRVHASDFMQTLFFSLLMRYETNPSAVVQGHDVRKGVTSVTGDLRRSTGRRLRKAVDTVQHLALRLLEESPVKSCRPR